MSCSLPQSLGAPTAPLRRLDNFHFEGPPTLLADQRQRDVAFERHRMMKSVRRHACLSFPLRRYLSADAPAISEIQNVAYPERPLTPEEVHFFDEQRDPRCRMQRWVIEHKGELIAFAEYDQPYIVYHPGKYTLKIVVRPEFQGLGIGTRLYEELMRALKRLNPDVVRVVLRQELKPGIIFLKQRGFEVSMRDVVMALDVAAADLTAYQGLESKLSDEGIQIQTMRELAFDPDRNRKLYDLENALLSDAPFPEGTLKMSFESFSKVILESPGFSPDGYFVAIHKGEYIGSSSLLGRQVMQHLWSHLTGVKPAYRRKQIALALKVQTIAYAKKHGFPTILVANESSNVGMIALNRSLGFRPLTSRISFVRQF